MTRRASYAAFAIAIALLLHTRNAERDAATNVAVSFVMASAAILSPSDRVGSSSRRLPAHY